MAGDESARLTARAQREAGRELVGSERPRSELRPEERLRAKADFTRVFKQGTRLDGAWFVLLGWPNKQSRSRIGLAVGRHVGGAVVRNRAKRVLREAFRHNKPEPPLDLVLVAKPGLRGRGALEVAREFRSRLARLRSAQKRRPRARPAGRD